MNAFAKDDTEGNDGGNKSISGIGLILFKQGLVSSEQQLVGGKGSTCKVGSTFVKQGFVSSEQ